MTHENLLGGPPDTICWKTRGRRALAAGDDPAVAAARFPQLRGLGRARRARARGRYPVSAYAYARTGYHRGLDQLRRAGWKGYGPVPWEHEPNRGFLRPCTARAGADAIGEDHEASRCQRVPAPNSSAAAVVALTRPDSSRLPRPSGSIGLQEPLCRACGTRSDVGGAFGLLREGTCDMPAIVIVGAQWGDEGKGKATDLLGDRVDYVVRYQGGNNAGHTVVIGDESYALHLLPSGVLSDAATAVIGNGVVINPDVLLEEIDGLIERGVWRDRLLISADAHLIMPHQIALDKVTERYLGSARIGTTGRGIGPAYSDKASRVGIRVQDLFDPGILQQKLELALREKNQVLTKLYNRRGIEAEAGGSSTSAMPGDLEQSPPIPLFVLNNGTRPGQTCPA